MAFYMKLQFVQGESLFLKTNKVPRQYNYLTENISTDVIIVGGGVTGSILGYYFIKQGIDAVILEKHRIASGSTSITTSLLQYELDSKLRELEKYTSIENGIMSYKLGLKALDEISEFINMNGNKCNYLKRDTLLYTSKNLEIAEIQEEFRLRKENGLAVDFITQENNPFSFDLKAGVYGYNGGAEIDPYEYTHHLLEVSCKKGLRVYENSEVLKVNYSEDKVEVQTQYDYTVKGKIIIIATGYDTQLFTKRNFGVKTTTFNIATKPVKNFDGWENRILIRDNASPYNYLRTTWDNRIIIGGEDVAFVPDIFNEHIAMEKYQILEQRVKNMFPQIKDIEVEYKYCGAFASTPDNIGFIGKDPNHSQLWYCLGYGANGILFAILGGMMLSKLYLGEIDENMKLFSVNRFDK